jgi:hypothetical protein
MKEEFRKLYAEYKEEINKAELWTHESIEGFLEWLLTGKI